MGQRQEAIEILERGLGRHHDGYQLYASLGGVPFLDVAGGRAQADVPMTTDSLTMWFSSGKIVTAVAIAQLWERGRLGLDDRVERYLPSFGNGKQRATVRHLLTHTAGFPYADDSLHPPDWPTLVRLIADAPAQWEPGTAAGYHGTAAHVILGELVRLVDGRPIERYVRDEIFDPLDMHDSYLALPAAELPALRPRLAHIQDLLPKTGPHAIPGLDFGHYNHDDYLGAISPGNTCRGPARELGRLYEALLAAGAMHGRRILATTTVEAITACHRRGMVDVTFAANNATPHPIYGHEYPWGLGMALDGNGDIGSLNSRRAYGSSGAFSSVGFADPEVGLACVIVTTGLIELGANQERLASVADAVNRAIRTEVD
jgi:CubicO group peptidase (beta-lactamase class C family)